MPIEVWLAERTDPQRGAAEAVLAMARRYRGLVVEAVTVGVLIKRERTIVELHPKTRWLELSFISTAAIASDRIARVIETAAGHAYFVHLVDETSVDAELRGWLAGALRIANARAQRASDRAARVASATAGARARDRGTSAPPRARRATHRARHTPRARMGSAR